MMNEHSKGLADYRLQQARETLQEAEGLFVLACILDFLWLQLGLTYFR